MTTAALPSPRSPSFFAALGVQMRVIGALILRELHTRYGRENIGYLWLIGEPLMLASVMATIHSGSNGHTQYGTDITPMAFTVLGYTTFIMFRGIVNRSEGALESNAPLLYHSMVTIFDITTARALIEAAGTFMAYVTLVTLFSTLGLMNPPVRPLYLILAELFMFWCAWSQSLIVTAITFDNRTIGRLVHPYSYFMIPLSGAFFEVSWIPEPYRTYLLWLPLPHIMEMARYGQFEAGTLEYVDIPYLCAVCAVTTWLGLVAVRVFRRKMHLG